MKDRGEFIKYVRALYNKLENAEEKERRFKKLVSKFPSFLLKGYGIILGKTCIFAYLTLYAFSDDPTPFEFKARKFLVHFVDNAEPILHDSADLIYIDTLVKAYLIALAEVTGLKIAELERHVGLYDEETKTFIDIVNYKGEN